MYTKSLLARLKMARVARTGVRKARLATRRAELQMLHAGTGDPLRMAELRSQKGRQS